MTFPFRRKIEFYSSKTKARVLDEVEKMLAEEEFTRAETETVTGSFVIRTTDRLLLFDVVLCGEIYEFEEKTFVILTAKMRLFVEILLLFGTFAAASFVFDFVGNLGIYGFFIMIGLFVASGLVWLINYLQFKPSLNSIRSKLE
jgi:hypothetical protein